MSTAPVAPWYRQFWPWFLIALPATVVLASIVTIAIAASTRDSLVVDDYGKIGMITERHRVWEQQAARLGVQARLHLARREGQLMLVVQGLETAPQTLQLRLSHPTLAERDQTLELTGSGDGIYRASLSHVVEGRRYVQLESATGAWRLIGELPAGSESLSLTPHS